MQITKLCVLAALALVPVLSTARDEDTARTWETSLGVRRLDAYTIAFARGSAIAVNDDTGFGFDVGYNFTSAFKLSVSFDMFEPRYTATIVPDDPAQDIEQTNGRVALTSTMLSGTYHFLPGPITPFVSAGLGWLHVDTDVPSGEPRVGCWWDTWWGYICDYYVPTRQEDDFAYQASVGARWRITPRLFLRGAFSRQWVDVSRASNTPHLDLLKLDLGFRM